MLINGCEKHIELISDYKKIYKTCKLLILCEMRARLARRRRRVDGDEEDGDDNDDDEIK